MQPVAAYVRMSTEHQKYSIANQIEAVERFCADRGLSLLRVYTDAARTGLSLRKRPGLQQLMTDAQRGGPPFKAVVVLDVSRLGRFQNLDEAAWVEYTLKQAGAPVIYCGEAFTQEPSPTAAIMKVIKRAMAAEYSRELGNRIAAGSRRVASEGWRVGGVAGYGYRRVVVDDQGRVLGRLEARERKATSWGRTTLELGPPEEVAAVRRVFDLYVNTKLGHQAIAKRMAAEGWPPPAPRTFCKGWVACVLANEKYAGHLIYGKVVNRLGAGAWRANPSDWVRVENAHPAIVAPSLFAAAQRRRRHSGPRFTREAILSGLRRLHRRYGMVSASLIAQAPFLPSATTVKQTFGSLTAAYAAASISQGSNSARSAQSRSRNIGSRSRRGPP